MQLSEAQQRAVEIRSLYAQLETKRYGRAWNIQEIMLGFQGDVGDLAKLVQGAAGVRQFDHLDAQLAHELADCLWSVLVLADMLDVNLELAFKQTMAQLETAIQRRLLEGEQTAD